jgi:RNA polymerase sigma factor (sigma-70 family)
VIPKRQRDPLADAERLLVRVYKYVSHRLGDGPEAEDVTSEVFENAVRYRKSYDSSKGEPVAWLLGIARRGVSNALAARVGRAEMPGEGPGVGDLESETINRLALDAALQCLGERDRDLIALRYGADLTASQIAQVLGVRKNAVEVALHRALIRLREEVQSVERTDQIVASVASSQPA